MKNTEIRILQEENTAWMTKVLFYEEEMKVMISCLQKTMEKGFSEENVVHIENLQNWFLILSQHLKNLKCGISESNREIANEIIGNKIAADHGSIKDHHLLRENMISLESSFLKLRIEFNSFTGKRV